MSGVVQTLVVALIVLAAVGFVARRAWATLRPRKADAGVRRRVRVRHRGVLERERLGAVVTRGGAVRRATCGARL
jgi:hypothetical protein